MEKLINEIYKVNEEIAEAAWKRDYLIEKYGIEYYEVEYKMYEVEDGVELIIDLLNVLGDIELLEYELDYTTEQEIKMYQKINGAA